MTMSSSNGITTSAVVGTVFAGFASFLIITNMSRMLGRAKTSYYYGKKSIQLRTRDGRETSLADLCKSILPPCQLNPFLFNGHLQTIWSILKSKSSPIYYKRWLFEQQDPAYPGTFAVDFVVKPYEPKDTILPRTTNYTKNEFDNIGSDDSKPMLVCLHGLSGGSYELYLRSVLAPLVTEEGGWEACVINSRGCAKSKITTPILFNARSTWDLRQTVKWLRETFPNRPLYGVGFSLGANILTNYLGEEGANCQFKAAVALSNPWSLDVSNAGLQSTWFKRNIYSRAMGTNLKKLYGYHKDVVLKNSAIDDQEVKNVRFLHEFDRAIQCPTWGYPTEQAYYRDASSTDSVLAIRIPFLAISAQDDPIVCDFAIPRQEFLQTPYGVLCTTSLGGHLGWFKPAGGRWMADATNAFFQKMAREVDQEHYSKNHPLPEGEIVMAKREPLRPWFDPMRRKMHAEA
ncbi:hypothetical protein PMZ80_002585 [Knufia obscura]|uniref:AB hydrolase-1 domain-containing protein n=1 Tax=Knufia obscura TaxID=1635080 RepID=A0ABR0RYN5_9EURO|nr:hypothetical protein PMZ80_002585 [Knufia obscura]